MATGAAEKDTTSLRNIAPFDFRKSNRIGKAQLRSVQLVYETFVRSLTTSLSAYLRNYIVVNLVSVEELSYAEFLEGLPSPTCMACLGLTPFEGTAVFEVNPSLVFPIIEILLGGNGKATSSINREVTEIEQKLMDGFLRIAMHDLNEAWKTIADIQFSVRALETEPQFLRVMESNDAIVAIGIEMTVGESTGLLNLALPSPMIKRMRQKSEQQRALRKIESTAADQQAVFTLLQDATVEMDARLEGSCIPVRELLRLGVGDVLMLDAPLSKPAHILLNGLPQFEGQVVSTGRKRGVAVGNTLAN